MNLILKRPLVVFDIESTGINPRVDRIVELAAIKIMPDSTRIEFSMLVNPQCPIPPETTELHGISDADVADAPTFAQEAPKLLQFLEGCDLAGFNIMRFDIPMLIEEFQRAKIHFNLQERKFVDAQKIFHQREPRNLSAALKFYCNKELVNAHSAMADTLATLEVIEGQCQMYQDLPREVEELDKISNPKDLDKIDHDGKLRWKNGQITIAFGQKAGRTLRDLVDKEPGFLRWIIKKDFSSKVKNIIKEALAGNIPTRPEQ